MKLHHIAIVFCSSAIATSAFADSMHNFPLPHTTGATGVETRQSSPGWQTTAAAPAGKTRQQVMEELRQAERDGLVPTSRSDYPPSERLIEMNKERYAAVHRGVQTQAKAQ